MPWKGLAPWYHGWNVLAVGIFTTAVFMGVFVFSFTFFVVEWVEEFGSSRAFTMFALSGAQICAGLFFPIAGRAMDRFPIRWIASLGVILFAISLVMMSFATSIWHIVIVYSLFVALADALAGPLVAQTLAAKWFRDHRGLAIGLAALGTSIGGFLVPPVVTYFIVEHGWRVANFYIAGLMVVATVPLLAVIVRGEPGESGDRKQKVSEATQQVSGDTRGWSTREILTSRNFWLIVLAFLPLMEVSTALISNLALWTKDLNIGTQQTGFLMSLLAFVSIVGKLVFGHLADRIEVRILFFVAVGLLIVALLLMIGHPSYPLLTSIVVMAGTANGAPLPMVGILIGRNFGAASFGAAMGLFYLCIRPVAFSGPIAGWVRDFFGSYDFFWIACLIVILCFTPALYWVKPPPTPTA